MCVYAHSKKKKKNGHTGWQSRWLIVNVIHEGELIADTRLYSCFSCCYCSIKIPMPAKCERFLYFIINAISSTVWAKPFPPSIDLLTSTRFVQSQRNTADVLLLLLLSAHDWFAHKMHSCSIFTCACVSECIIYDNFITIYKIMCAPFFRHHHSFYRTEFGFGLLNIFSYFTVAQMKIDFVCHYLNDFIFRKNVITIQNDEKYHKPKMKTGKKLCGALKI